jgi:hypothetical protein
MDAGNRAGGSPLRGLNHREAQGRGSPDKPRKNNRKNARKKAFSGPNSYFRPMKTGAGSY